MNRVKIVLLHQQSCRSTIHFTGRPVGAVRGRPPKPVADTRRALNRQAIGRRQVIDARADFAAHFLVDDNAGLRGVLAKHLSRRGFQVRSAASGSDHDGGRR